MGSKKEDATPPDLQLKRNEAKISNRSHLCYVSATPIIEASCSSCFCCCFWSHTFSAFAPDHPCHHQVSMPHQDRQVTIGVLALQGAFHEHITHLNRCLSSSPQDVTISAIAVRTPQQLSTCHALIIPGGESTAIALGAARGGLLEPLRAWVAGGKPVWGTCAGMIMLAREATGGKKMQELIGGWDGRVSRNGWGSQVSTCSHRESR